MRLLCYAKQYELSNPNPIRQLHQKYRGYKYSSSYFEKNWQYFELLNELYNKFAHSNAISSKIKFSTECSRCKRKVVVKLFKELGFEVIRYEKLYGRIKVIIVPL